MSLKIKRNLRDYEYINYITLSNQFLIIKRFCYEKAILIHLAVALEEKSTKFIISNRSKT